MLGREAIFDIDRQVSRLGELHPQLAMRLRAAADPTAAVQVDDYRMRSVALGHRNIGGETRTKLDGLVKGANLGRVRVQHRRKGIHRRAQSLHISRNGSLGECLEKSAFLFGQHG